MRSKVYYLCFSHTYFYLLFKRIFLVVVGICFTDKAQRMETLTLTFSGLMSEMSLFKYEIRKKWLK